MATMYSIFFSVLLTAVCSVNGGSNSDVISLYEDSTGSSFFTSFRLERSGTEGSTSFIGKLTSYAVSPIRLHFVPLHDEAGHSRVTGGVRDSVITIASKELGVREATGKNDGPRVEEYLAYTGLGKHHEWCAAFVSWCYGQGGMDVPRNPWSPALFPKAQLMDKAIAQAADVFGIYGVTAKRINHVGLVKEK